MITLRTLSSNRDLRELVSFASQTFILRALGAVAAFAFNVVLAQALGAAGAGVYYLAVTVISITGVVCRLGLENIALREVSADIASERRGHLTAVVRRSLALVITASAVMGALVAAASGFIARDLFHEASLVGPLRIMSVSLVPASLYLVSAEVLRGAKRIGQAALIKGAGSQVVGLVLLLGLACCTEQVSVRDVAIVHVLSSLLVLLAVVFFLSREQLLRGKADATVRVRWLLAVGRPMLMIALVSVGMDWIDTVCLKIWHSSGDVGVYNAAIRTARTTGFILVAVNSIAAPKYSALFAGGRTGDLERVARQSSALMIVATLPLLVMFVAFPSTVMGLFGAEFQTAAVALRILALGQLVNVVTGSVGFILLMTGLERSFRNVMMTFMVVDVLLNILLVPPLGVVGAAIATTLTLAGRNIAVVLVGRRRLGVNAIPLGPPMVRDV